MIIKQARALVLHVADYGESDKLVTLYSKERGKQNCIAKGAKRSKKRFVNKLEMFSLLDVYYAENRNSSLFRIDQADLLSSFAALRSDFSRFAASQLLCELMLYWTRENDADSHLFDLLQWSLETLDRGAEIGKTLVLFQIKLLDGLGYRPRLKNCIDCSAPGNSAVSFRFAPSRGGLVCGSCTPNHFHTAGPLSLGTVKLLEKAQELDIVKIDRLQFSALSIREALQVLREYNRHLLQRDIRSWEHVPID